MKTKLSTLMIFVLIAGILIGCKSAAAETTNIGEGDAGKTIELKTGDTLVVSLDGNITTGYNWVPTIQDPALLKQIGEVEVTPESDALGAGGKIVLKFETTAKGQTTLHLDYKQPWDTETAPEKTFEVTVVVK